MVGINSIPLTTPTLIAICILFSLAAIAKLITLYVINHTREYRKNLPEINKNEPNSIEKESSDISPKKKRIFNITFPKIILVDK
jgi:hypothetical protein